MIFLGDDWAEAHHDIYICNEHGDRLAARRLPEGIAGVTALHELVSGHADVVIRRWSSASRPNRGLWVQSMIEAGYQVYAINPRAASRYRDRHSLSGAKSDAGDAKMLAELVRTDRHNHRQVAGDSDLAEGIKILARAHQNLIWERTRHTNRLRSSLREYYPPRWPPSLTWPIATRSPCSTGHQPPHKARPLTPGRVPHRAASPGDGHRNIDTRAPNDRRRPARRVSSKRQPWSCPRSPLPRGPQVAILRALNEQIAASRPSWPPILNSTRTPTSTSPCQDSVSSSAPGRSTEFGDDPNRYPQRQVSQELRRHITHHPSIRHPPRRPCPLRSTIEARRRPRSMGLLQPQQQRRLQRLLPLQRGPAVTPTTKPCEPSATASSASSTAASPHHTTYDEATAWAHRSDQVDQRAA